jgi:hypothetical protein
MQNLYGEILMALNQVETYPSEIRVSTQTIIIYYCLYKIQ